jgi:hypothetical protein
MAKSSRSGSLFQRWLPSPAAAGADAADLGTCFGLEISLAAAENEARAADAPAPRRAARWIRRLTPRTRPLA